MGAPKLKQEVQRINRYSQPLFERAMHQLYGDTMTEEALDKSEKEVASAPEFSQHLAWCQIAYVVEEGTKEIDTKKCFGVRTYKSLFHHAMQDKAVFYAPNGSCSRKGYRKGNDYLRWINSIVVDIDEIIDLDEVLRRISKAKLPVPTMINRTPSGGWHVYWILKKRIEGWYKSNKSLYDKVAKAIQVAIGGDPFAKSASNYYRIPKDIQFFQEEKLFTMLKFKNWYKRAAEENYLVKEADKERLLQHPAIIELSKGVSDGCRNTAAFSLAAVYRYEGYSYEETLNKMQEWNQLNAPPLSNRDLIKRVDSAFKKEEKLIPLNFIHEITNIKVNIGTVVAFKKNKKERSKRKNSHFEEIVEDLFFYLEENGPYYGSQKGLVDSLVASSGFTNIKERTVKELVKALKNGLHAEKVKVEIIGKGRGAKTRISLLSPIKNEETRMTVEDNKQGNNVINLVPHLWYKKPINNESLGKLPILYHKCSTKLEGTVNRDSRHSLCTTNVVQQLRFEEKCGQICTTTVVQKTKNLRQKSKKTEENKYSSNLVMSKLKGGIELKEEMVQSANKHKERMVGTVSKMPGGPPLECGYQYFHKVHSENVLAVDAVDPCGNVDNRRLACGQKNDYEREDDS